jgi:hypothetical protein
MNKIAVVVLSDTTSLEGLGRMVNALEAVKECKEGGDAVQLIFDGAGAKWIAELERPDHRAHPLYRAVKDTVAGACGFCAGAFGVTKDVAAAGVPTLAQYDGHPSFRKLINDGYRVLTF